MARTGAAIDRYLTAFENGTLDPEDLAGRLAQLKTRSQQLRARRDELAGHVAAIPTTPPATALRRVADHVADIVAPGSHTQRKALIEALIAQVKITGPGRVVPVFRIPSRQQRIMHRFQGAWQPRGARPPKIRFAQWPIWWGRWDSNPHWQEPKSCASAVGLRPQRQTPSSLRSLAT
jgi:hypothetical protein